MITLLMLAGCTDPARQIERDPTREAWYAETTQQLSDLAKQAIAAHKNHNDNEAANFIQQGEPLVNKVLMVNRPTIEAMQAASDLDDLYGQMLLGNRHYGWARLLFQKNLARWKNWTPNDAAQESERTNRLKLATNAIAECDKHL